MKAKISLIIVITLFLLSFSGCASISQAHQDLNTTPDNQLRGDPANTGRVREYLENILASPDEYELRAYSRKPFSIDTKKGLFLIHYFYVYFKNGDFEHTLVFTDTPKGSERKGNWMLDAGTDVESYREYLSSNNVWGVEEYRGPKGVLILDTVQTTQNILTRLEKNYKFFGPAVVRDLAWYHQLWMFMVPPPILAYGPMLLVSIHKDNCASAVLETVAWKPIDKEE